MPHRERIATAMALIAMFGAVTTFRASQNELIASGCARRYAVAATYFIYRKEYYANRLDANAEYEDAYKIHVSRARRYLTDASMSFPPPWPDKAFFEVEAQLEYAAARQLQRLKDFTTVELDKNLEVDANLNTLANADMRTAGLGGGCMIGAHHASGLTSLKLLESDTGSVRDRAIRCAKTVGLFVLALVCLTLSAVVPIRLKHTFELAGYAISVLAVILGIFWSDKALALLYALAVAAVALVTALGWAGLRMYEKSRRTSIPPVAESAETEILRLEEFDTEGFRAKHLHLFQPHDAFARVVVIAIAFTVFLSAIAGLAYSEAIGAGDTAAMQADGHQANILSTYAHEAMDMHFMMREMDIGMEGDLREASLKILRYGMGRRFSRNDVAPWLYEAVQWRRAFDDLQTSKGESMHQYLETADGPYRDVRYPYAMYYRSVAIAPARELALADAYDEDASIYERGGTYCLLMITIFAIALYLFGQALAMGKSNAARMLALFGAALVLAGIGVGLGAAHVTRTANGDKLAFSRACPQPTEAPVTATRAEVAASCYAQGEFAREVANNREDYKTAVNAFQPAVTLRPKFALAQYRLLTAEGDYATPQRTGYVSIEDPTALPELVKERQALSSALGARDLSPPSSFLSEAAFDTYIESLINSDASMLSRSIDMARSDPNAMADQTSQYNIGLMLLADNKITEATNAYAAGLRIKPQDEEADVSSVSDLELLRTRCAGLAWQTPASCGRLAQTARSLKTQLLQHAFSMVAGRPQSTTLDVRAWVAPDGVAWSAPAQQLQRIHGTLAVLWYLKDPTWHSWYAHLALMHHMSSSSMARDGDRLVDYSSYLNDSHFIRCLPTRQDFRVEIYANGQLIGASSRLPGRADDPDFSGGQFTTADIAFCYPKALDPRFAWIRRISGDGYPDGTYSDPRKHYTIQVIGDFEPKLATQADTDGFLRYMLVNYLPLTNIAGLRLVPFDCAPPLNRFHAVYIRAAQPRNEVLGKGWTTPDGFLHFVFIQHTFTRGDAPDRLGCEILNSAQPMYPDMY